MPILFFLFVLTSCVALIHADFSDDEQVLLSRIGKLKIHEMVSVQFVGRRTDVLRRPGGYYTCRTQDEDTVWVVFVKSAIRQDSMGFRIDSICAWSGNQVMQTARRDWPHESIEDFKHRRPFGTIIALMEDFGLHSFETQIDGIKIRKLYRDGEYRDFIIDRSH